MTPDEVALRLHRAMDAATGLPPEDIDQIEVLIRVGERLVAFETLCTQIYEYEIALDPDTIRELVGVGHAIGAQESYLKLLRDEG